jgi:hypothetical protein
MFATELTLLLELDVDVELLEETDDDDATDELERLLLDECVTTSPPLIARSIITATSARVTKSPG